MNASPAIALHFPDVANAALRDRLVALLAEYGLVAIHEDDVAAPRRWVAHFLTSEARDAAVDAIAALPDTAALRLETIEVEDEDWARRTQADLPAIQIGRIIVAPPWDLPPHRQDQGRPDDGREGSADRRTPSAVLIEIEPSRGFGTGHHESTRLCLVLLQARDLNGRSVLDVGTGSGVLAIAASKLGAPFVSAIDVDPDAVENARENIARNDVDGRVEAHGRDFTADETIAAADLVTANLTGTLLVRHTRELGRFVRPGGTLIVAGFTEDERDLVSEAFAPEFSVVESAQENGWWAFALARSRR